MIFLLLFVVAGFACITAPNTYAEEGFTVTGKAAYLTDYDTGAVIFEMNADDKLQIASMVKIMTSLLAFEAIERGEAAMEEEVEVSSAAAGMGGSQIFLSADVR